MKTSQQKKTETLENFSKHILFSKMLGLKLCSQGKFIPRIRDHITVLLFLILASGCAPQRAPLHTAEIPRPTQVTPQDEQFGHELLGELTQKYELDYNHPRRNEVDVAVGKLTNAIGASTYPWHVNVFSDPSVKNAAATKGNHIFIWTGMIDATQNEDELAGVLAHEISHVLLKHTEPTDGEQFRQIMIQIGAMAVGTAASVAIGGSGAQIAGDLASSATQQVGEGLLMNPFNREKELEADIVGLYLVKKAGYDPQALINFWRRALNDPAFSSSIPFLSTHPPAQERLIKLEQELRKIENLPITVSPEITAPQFPPFGKDPNNGLPPQNTPAQKIPPKNLPQKNNPPTPALPPSSQTEQNDIGQNGWDAHMENKREEETKPSPSSPPLPGIKSEGPLAPGDSFDVGPDIMKNKFP